MKSKANGAREKDVLDRLEEFIEERIEAKLKKGMAEVEKFVKEELLRSDEARAEGKDPSYLEIFLKDKKVAAVIPSTKFIIERVLKQIPWGRTRCIVEYGPAQGVITRRLLERLPEDGTLLAVETNADFVASLSKIHDPRLKAVHGSVTDIPAIAAKHGIGGVDAVVSGIPFSFLKPVQRHQLLHKTEDLLRPGGRFIAYQVTTHLVPLMKYHFENVDVQYEVRNLPPHFVFTGIKPE